MIKPKLNKRNSKNQVISNQPLKADITLLSYANKNLQFLDDISLYHNIIHIDIRDNLINNKQQLFKLKYPNKLRILKVEGNPICNQINYKYPILLCFSNLQQLDDIKFNHQQRQKLINIQQNLCSKIIQLLYFKSKYFEQLTKNSIQKQLFNIDILKQKISQSLKKLKQINSQEQFYHLNFKIQAFIQEICNVYVIDEVTNKRIHSYWIKSIIQFANQQSNNKLLKYLISKIKINQQFQQKQLQQSPQLCFKLIQQILVDQYQSNSICSVSHSKKSYFHEGSTQTFQTYHSTSFKYIHFCLDEYFLQVVYELIIQNIKSLSYKLEIYQKKIKGQKQQAYQMALKLNRQYYCNFNDDSLDFTLSTLQQKKPTFTNLLQQKDQFSNNRPTKRIQYKLTHQNSNHYKNNLTIIYIQFIGTVEKLIKKNVFKCLLKAKRVNVFYFNKFINEAQNLINQRFKISFHKIKAQYQWQLKIQKRIQKNKLQLVFKCWRKIKVKKAKILKSIILKKQKINNILLGYSFNKWKTLMRLLTIKKVTSNLNLSKLKLTKPTLIDQNYKNVIKKYGLS